MNVCRCSHQVLQGSPARSSARAPTSRPRWHFSLPRRLDAELLVAVALPRAPLDAGQVLGPTENAPGHRARLEDLRGQEPRLRAPLATTGNEPADSAAH